MSHALVFPQCLMSQHFHNVSSLTDSTVFWSCLSVSTSHPSIFPPCLILKYFNSVSCLNVSTMSHPWMFPCLLPQSVHNVSSLSVSTVSHPWIFPRLLLQCFYNVSSLIVSTVSRGVQAVNEAIVAGDTEALVAALTGDAGFQSSKNECGATYLEKLKQLQEEKAASGLWNFSHAVCCKSTTSWSQIKGLYHSAIYHLLQIQYMYYTLELLAWDYA